MPDQRPGVPVDCVISPGRRPVVSLAGQRHPPMQRVDEQVPQVMRWYFGEGL
jgi:hypothetical protein